MTQNSLPGPKMIFIPGGTYQMGESEALVTVVDFYMDETPVTVAQYREAVNAGAVSAPAGLDRDIWSNWGVVGRENHPVNCVDCHQAKAYADWAGKRLPTDEEWEWAARGGYEAREYPWGGAEHPPRDQLCWNGKGNDLGRGNRMSTSPVGSYPKGDSRHGLKDMAGNVWEWAVSISELNVGRGGSWFSTDPDYVRASYYNNYSPTIRRYNIGFRCVRDA